MRQFALLLLATLGSLSLTAGLLSAAEPPADPRTLFRPLPGTQNDGAVLLPNQWSLRPTGRQVELGNFPVNVSLHPKGNWAAVLHSGYGPHEVIVVDLKTESIVSRVTLPRTFYGLSFTPNGKQLLVSGGEDDVVYQFHFADGYLSDREVIDIPKKEILQVPAGLACSHDGQWLYAACCLGDRLAALPLGSGEKPWFVALPQGSRPYTALASAKSERLYVSLWGKSSVAVVDRAAKAIEAKWQTASHPTEMVLSPDEDLLYAACADSNTVSVLDTKTGRQIEVITTSLYPQSPHGSTPNSLALAPNGKTLWVANADANNLAVIDVSHRGQSASLGFIPVGWYPTSVRMSDGAEKIFVANGKGLTSKANRNGPQPQSSTALLKNIKANSEYIAGLFPGALSIIDTPNPNKMPALTKAAYACSPLRPDFAPQGTTAIQTIPFRPRSAMPARSNTASMSSRRTGPTTRSSATFTRATATRTCAFFPSGSRPICTPWPGNSCCWTISTSTAR